MFPAAPFEVRRLADGGVDRLYDTDADGKPDYAEHLDDNGVVEHIRYDRDENGDFEEDVALARVPDSERRDLVLLLDSVPFGVVRDTWNAGRLRLFFPPSRTISPFPVMTDVSFAEFFDVSPCPGIESEFYDGRSLADGYDNYAHERNTPWHRGVDYHLNHYAHAFAYISAAPWFDHELAQFQRIALSSDRRTTVCYSAGSSAMGAYLGRNGHEIVLNHVDRMCQWIVCQSHGRIRVSMLSDHGHNLVNSHRIPLPETLARLGWHVTDRIRGPADVVVPQFGVVTCAALWTLRPEALAQDCIGLEGVEHALWRDPQDRVVVLGRDGWAVVEARDGRYSYHAERGDPLKLAPIIELLRRQGRLDAGGFADDQAWFEATRDHVYPDPLQRVWRAFHGLVVHTPDVLLAVADGYHSGSAFQSHVVQALRAAHGNLGMPGSSGFVASMAGPLPVVSRMKDLRAALAERGVQMPVRADAR